MQTNRRAETEGGAEAERDAEDEGTQQPAAKSRYDRNVWCVAILRKKTHVLLSLQQDGSNFFRNDKWLTDRPWLLKYTSAQGELVVVCKARFHLHVLGHRDKIGNSTTTIVRLEALRRHERNLHDSNKEHAAHKSACDAYTKAFGSLEAPLPPETWRRLPRAHGPERHRPGVMMVPPPPPRRGTLEQHGITVTPERAILIKLFRVALSTA